ncbi:MAG TPA: bifunctional UDP-N-acetylglucosamine diphosphorylase/glucosamine-1-phosphate N-acetyltransferase GlmU [Polyangia bacterium]|nr:bifunctional UDP-N-acetylglucosamine diphosphorylase/glucosamine-1-phosphate N-acetyltransferase GlmU [Polyangia bacterium]
MHADLSVVILAAGQGTRMKSSRAKVLHTLGGQPLVCFPIERARELGAARIVVVLGHQHAEVTAVIEQRFGADAVEVALQLEQLGTAHAVAQAAPKLGGARGPILIIYADVPLLTADTLRRLCAGWRPGGLALVTARPTDPHGYGRIVRTPDGLVARIVEEKDATPAERRIAEINAGIYCVDAALLREALERVGRKNAQREFYLTDLAEMAAQRGRVEVVEADADEVAGINDRAQLAACEARLHGQLARALMTGGVTIRDPARVRIDLGVTVGADTEIGPGVELRGGTRIGSGCRIEAGSILSAATVGDGVHIRPYCVLAQCTVGPGAVVGPFAHLRPGTELAEGVHIGNFVETKKARLGKGSKANHLTYLGDAELGAGVNVGAGTITCNYDGVAKQKTVIEDGVFIGSDTQLVAPVTVGAGAYIGAGTTVTRPVPPRALAISRAPQKNIEGYATRKQGKRK